VHDYLSSVEQRAHAAELAAEKARIKAAEERRARRLTIALAGAIALVLLLGGGGYVYVGHERSKRTEQTRAAVEAAHGESIELGRAGKPADALAAARRALALAETGDADAALLERARGFVTQAELDQRAAELERTLREQDERLRDRLVDLRIGQIATIGNRQSEIELDAAFAQAFRDYGADLEGEDLVPALKRIRERAIAEEVALALDDWGRLRRKVHGARSEKAENLFLLAMDLDADPERQRLRQAIADNDLDVLLELAAPESLAKLAPGSIFVLSAVLWDGYPQHRPDVYRMFDQALYLHPSDYVLQAVGGIVYDLAGRSDSALICRSAALALRPHDPAAQWRMGEALAYLGRLTDAVGALRACIAENPRHQEALWSLGVCQNQLGDHAGALESLTRALALGDNPDLRADILGTRFLAGVATRDEVEALAVVATGPLELVNTLYPLVDHPDPARRDPEFVRRMIRERGALLGKDVEFYILDSVSRVRVGDWAGALAALEGRYFQSKLLLMTPNAFDFMRSLIYSQLGNHEAARECHARGVSEWNSRTAGNPAAWQHSDAMRWRREAEAALAK
jgi:tetratricopeptide (TPR) repeat protein